MSLIEIIPCLSDNYAYLIRDEKTNKNILVDAPEHGPIETYLDKKALNLDAILITHHPVSYTHLTLPTKRIV